MNTDAYRRARMASATGEAARLLAEADERAVARVDRARASAETAVAEARVAGAADADREMTVARARAHYEARRIVLRAQNIAYEALLDEARTAALELRDRTGYAALVDRLERLAREQLGPAAQIERDPADAGGVRGRAGGESVDYTLGTLAERCVRAMGADLERLWT